MSHEQTLMQQFIEDAQRTKSEQYNPFMMTRDLVHALIGISTESGELLDVLKKAFFYGKDIDYVNLDEEVGDVLWYIAIYAKARGTTFERLSQTVTAKLRARFPDKFTSERANNRDLFEERQVLERHLCDEDAYASVGTSDPGDEDSPALDMLQQVKKEVETMGQTLSAEITELQADVAAKDSIEASTETLLSGLTQRLETALSNAENAGLTPDQVAEFAAIHNDLVTGNAGLQAAVTANTPADPSSTTGSTTTAQSSGTSNAPSTDAPAPIVTGAGSTTSNSTGTSTDTSTGS